MREILFRGKHIHELPQNEHLDGTWAYGYLCDENYINSPDLEGEFLIDPKTVCQYTGLKDRNGRKIFEGDIVKLPCDDDGDDPYIMHVKYSEKYKMFTTNLQEEGDDNDSIISFLDVDLCEVIGNIFDNPDLCR